MPLDETAKSRYIDALDAHIASLKEQEQREYIEHLTGDMSEYVSAHLPYLAVGDICDSGFRNPVVLIFEIRRSPVLPDLYLSLNELFLVHETNTTMPAIPTFLLEDTSCRY